jgi:hypothetical protein
MKRHKLRKQDSRYYTYRDYDLLKEGNRWVIRHPLSGDVMGGGHKTVEDAALAVDDIYEFGPGFKR